MHERRLLGVVLLMVGLLGFFLILPMTLGGVWGPMWGFPGMHHGMMWGAYQGGDQEAVIGDDEVVIRSFAFTPETVEVEVGTTVTWTNYDVAPHTVTSGTHEAETDTFDSGLLQRGESWSYTFTEPGTYAYHCDPHPYMEGIVTVRN